MPSPLSRCQGLLRVAEQRFGQARACRVGRATTVTNRREATSPDDRIRHIRHRFRPAARLYLELSPQGLFFNSSAFSDSWEMSGFRDLHAVAGSTGTKRDGAKAWGSARASSPGNRCSRAMPLLVSRATHPTKSAEPTAGF